MPGVKCTAMAAQRGTMSVGDLAKASNTHDLVIRTLEAGGNCRPHEAQRIADALGISLATLGVTTF